MSTFKMKKNKHLSDDLLSAFCRDTAMLLEANIPLYLGYSDIYRGLTEGTEFKSAMDSLVLSVEQNGRLSEVFSELGCFPKHLCEMTAVGEQTGRLDEIMNELAVYYDRMFQFRKRINSAVIYPVVLICMMTVVIAVLIYSVLPVFADVLLQFNSAAAQNTDSIMQISMVICSVILFLLIATVILVLIGFALSNTQKGARFISRFFEHFAPTKQLSYNISVSHFVSGLCAMLKSGFSVDDALKTLIPAVENKTLYIRLENAHSLLKQGTPQGAALTESEIFDDMDNHLIVVSGRTGAMDTASEQLSIRYDEKVSDTLDKLIAVIEPSLIAVLTLVIGAVMLSVMLPLIQIMSSIG